jgi:hypothetical protein
MNFLGSGMVNSNPNPSAASSSNKRLRMMSQQNPHPNLLLYNPPPQPMEPLNLAIAPSASNSLSYPNNQFSTFLGYSVQSSGGRLNGSPAPPLGPIHYASTFPNNSNAPNSLYAAQSARLSKEGPVPVEKGSGSDSGVCSENDSDVSPPMAPFPGHPRRSVLSQDLPTSGKEPSQGSHYNSGEIRTLRHISPPFLLLLPFPFVFQGREGGREE